MKENLVYNINRLLVGTTIVIVLFITYFFNLDIFLYFFVSILIFYEFYKSILKNKLIIISLFALFIFQLLFFNYFISNNIFLVVLTLFFFICSFYIHKNFKIFFLLFVINIITLISILYVINREIIYLIIFLSFFNDTVAYVIGSYFKGPLISPKISPKKTWSGTMVSFLTTSLILIFIDYDLLIASIIAISLFYGDIYFSFIKRKLNIKDFSNILSTHGGVLDRIDSFIFLIIIFVTLNL